MQSFKSLKGCGAGDKQAAGQDVVAQAPRSRGPIGRRGAEFAGQHLGMKLGEVAQFVGLKPDVVRFYVRAGLLVPRREAGNGYKRFFPEDVTRLRIIRAARVLDISIAEISGLLEKFRRGGNFQLEMNNLLLRKHAELRCRRVNIDQTLERLRELWALCVARSTEWDDPDILCAAIEKVVGTGTDDLLPGLDLSPAHRFEMPGRRGQSGDLPWRMLVQTE